MQSYSQSYIIDINDPDSSYVPLLQDIGIDGKRKIRRLMREIIRLDKRLTNILRDHDYRKTIHGCLFKFIISPNIMYCNRIITDEALDAVKEFASKETMKNYIAIRNKLIEYFINDQYSHKYGYWECVGRFIRYN